MKTIVLSRSEILMLLKGQKIRVSIASADKPRKKYNENVSGGTVDTISQLTPQSVPGFPMTQ